MKKSVLIATALSLVIVFTGFAQTNNETGPQYKNAKPSVKYKGNNAILIRENPDQFQGIEYKNFKPRNYEKVIVDSDNFIQPDFNLIVSTENKIYKMEEEKEKIIYRRIQTKNMKGKNTKGLKGPAYKNYKPQ